ncbi:DUF2179 domain-containing protein [Bernardetia sp. Wsw4-3y2]|uniref:DUF2179 domain-containing protein n=1 Tax=unclassified Bernardetia TaxID=2647129 RepID=UPI0030CF219D
MQDFFYQYLNEDTIWVYAYVILPILIFLARLTDVSLSTLRIVLVTMGKRNIAPLIGFVEAFVWLLAIGQIMQNLTNIMSYLAYAGGFAMGTYLGMWLEQRIALGMVMVRIITGKTAEHLISKLKDTNYRFTHLQAEGKYGDVGVVFSIVKRKELPKFLHLINTHNPNAFYTIENIRHVQNTDDIPTSDSGTFSRVVRKIKTIRK